MRILDFQRINDHIQGEITVKANTQKHCESLDMNRQNQGAWKKVQCEDILQKIVYNMI